MGSLQAFDKRGSVAKIGVEETFMMRSRAASSSEASCAASCSPVAVRRAIRGATGVELHMAVRSWIVESSAKR